MKKLLLYLCLSLSLISCSTEDSSSNFSSDPPSGNPSSTTPCKYNGHILHKGSQGGCYYINSSGNKQYVDRSLCNC